VDPTRRPVRGGGVLTTERAATLVHGCADLVFARRGARTVLERSRVEAPMTVVRPFELPDGRLVVQLITLGPGLCGGDVVRITVTALDGARVIVTTTSATKVLSMSDDCHAGQHVRLEAGDDSSLEYYPCVTIPFPRSALQQTVTVTAAPTARVGVTECWALGRVARGEYLDFRSLASRTTLAVDGRLLYADALDLEPAVNDVAGAGVLSNRRYLAAGFWLGADNVGDLPASPKGAAATEVAFGPSAPGLVYLRALGDDGPAMDAVVQRSVELASRAWCVAAVRLDRFRC
jgi:urease accessory protein